MNAMRTWIERAEQAANTARRWEALYGVECAPARSARAEWVRCTKAAMDRAND